MLAHLSITLLYCTGCARTNRTSYMYIRDVALVLYLKVHQNICGFQCVLGQFRYDSMSIVDNKGTVCVLFVIHGQHLRSICDNNGINILILPVNLRWLHTKLFLCNVHISVCDEKSPLLNLGYTSVVDKIIVNRDVWFRRSYVYFHCKM